MIHAKTFLMSTVAMASLYCVNLSAWEDFPDKEETEKEIRMLKVIRSLSKSDQEECVILLKKDDLKRIIEEYKKISKEKK